MYCTNLFKGTGLFFCRACEFSRVMILIVVFFVFHCNRRRNHYLAQKQLLRSTKFLGGKASCHFVVFESVNDNKTNKRKKQINFELFLSQLQVPGTCVCLFVCAAFLINKQPLLQLNVKTQKNRYEHRRGRRQLVRQPEGTLTFLPSLQLALR